MEFNTRELAYFGAYLLWITGRSRSCPFWEGKIKEERATEIRATAREILKFARK